MGNKTNLRTHGNEAWGGKGRPRIIRTDSRLKERGSLPARTVGISVKMSSVLVCPSSVTELFPQHPSPRGGSLHLECPPNYYLA
jgi:hypothetical protein